MLTAGLGARLGRSVAVDRRRRRGAADGRRTGALALVGRLEVVGVGLTAAVVERHAPVLRLVKVPARQPFAARTDQPRQPTRVFCLLVCLFFFVRFKQQVGR